MDSHPFKLSQDHISKKSDMSPPKIEDKFELENDCSEDEDLDFSDDEESVGEERPSIKLTPGAM